MSPVCDDLDPFFDGELPQEAAGAFRDHLGDCDRCQRALRGRMLEAAVISTPRRDERAGTPVLDAIPLRPRARRLPRWTWAPMLAAAAALVIWWKVVPRSGPEAPAAPPAVALELKAERGGHVDVRFSDPSLDGYRPKQDAMRSAAGAPRTHENIGLKDLSELEQRNRLHALVGARALNGDLEGAARDAAQLPETAATLSDRAALALLDRDAPEARANPERALSLAVQARRLAPTLEPAMWNEAVALERLGLTLAAAAAFDEIAKRGGAGWPEEARQRAARLRQDYEGALAKWNGFQAAADAMERGGAVMASSAETPPSLVRKALHVAIAATADRARLDALAPLAAALELAPELARIRASRLDRRAPIASRLAAALAKPVPAELRAIRAEARRAGIEDIARAVALVIQPFDVDEEDVAELEALSSAGPWWRLAAAQRLAFYVTYRRRDYAEVDLLAHDVVESCREGTRGRDAYWCPRILRVVAAASAEIGRVDRAYDLVSQAQELAHGAGDSREEAGVFSTIGMFAATRDGDPFDPTAVSDAYLREADLRLRNCSSRLYRFDFPARAALDHHRFGDAARLLADADRVNQTECQELRYNAEEVRLRLILRQPTAERADELARRLKAIEAQYPDLDPGQRLLGEYYIARARLAIDPAQTGPLRAAIEKAGAVPDEHYRHKIHRGGHSALAEHAARRGDAAQALAAVAERMGVQLDSGCAVGINHDDRVTVAVRGADGRAEAAIHEVPEGRRVLGPQELLAAPMRRRLDGCERIDVLATGPYFGVPGLLGPELRWSYRSSPVRRTEPLRLEAQVVVTDVQTPADLGLPALRRMELASARTLEGAAATPEGVLSAIANAELVVINAHGITDANEPSAASLVLSPDRKLKGSYRLTADRVRHARLTRSPVIMLAACHAGRVQVSTEPWSLASSFLAAGARAVIAPTTEIPDQDANEVFEAIVRQMQSGSTPEQAVVKVRADRGGKSPWLANVVVFQ